jgi:hypothetical protein
MLMKTALMPFRRLPYPVEPSRTLANALKLRTDEKERKWKKKLGAIVSSIGRTGRTLQTSKNGHSASSATKELNDLALSLTSRRSKLMSRSPRLLSKLAREQQQAPPHLNSLPLVPSPPSLPPSLLLIATSTRPSSLPTWRFPRSSSQAARRVLDKPPRSVNRTSR